jgi:hypothetical protein
MNALHDEGITASSALYMVDHMADDTSLAESFDFDIDPVTNFSGSPAVTTPVGRGWVNFLGDVNAEESSTSTILVVLGMLDVLFHLLFL